MNVFKLKKRDNQIADTIKSNNAETFFKPGYSMAQSNNAQEHEADHLSEKVMQITDTGNSFFKPAGNLIQRKCSACEKEEKKVQRKEGNSAKSQGGMEISNYVNSLGTASGQPMSESSRQFFEPRFGYNFSGVRLHTDAVAAKSAKSINALAYTSGNNIVFNTGQYSADSDKGKKLMAHELTHVIQQQKDGQSSIQRMLACPAHLNDNDPVPPGFKNYFGNTRMFHCGFRTILEDRAPTPTDPMNECVYDHSGVLVTDSHRYANCQGTPDQYDSRTNSWDHTFHDSGGIWHAGGPAFGESMGYLRDRAVDAITQPFSDAYNWLDRGVRGIYGMP